MLCHNDGCSDFTELRIGEEERKARCVDVNEQTYRALNNNYTVQK